MSLTEVFLSVKLNRLCLVADNYYFLEGSKDALLCGNSSDAGFVELFFGQFILG